MSANSYRYLIRSSSICQSGFKRNFNDRCLTIFSCGNIADYANKPAVLLLDRTMATMRLVTFNVPEPKVAKLMITCTIMDLDAMKKRSSRETLSKK